MTKEKEFVFPMNYKNKEKFLGFIDYKVLCVIGAIAIIVFGVLNKINLSLIIKVCVFITVVGCFSIFIVVGINGENMVDFLYFAGKYFIKEKVYVYRKVDERKEVKACISQLKRGSQ